MEEKDLSLGEVILLDRVQKDKRVTREDARLLRRRGLIEGRLPQLRVAAHIADTTEDRVTYIRHRATDDAHYEQLIVDFIRTP